MSILKAMMRMGKNSSQKDKYARVEQVMNEVITLNIVFFN